MNNIINLKYILCVKGVSEVVECAGVCVYCDLIVFGVVFFAKDCMAPTVQELLKCPVRGNF